MLKEGRQAWDAQFIPVPSSTGTAAECPIYKYGRGRRFPERTSIRIIELEKKQCFTVVKWRFFMSFFSLLMSFNYGSIFFRPSKLKSIMDHHNMFFFGVLIFSIGITRCTFCAISKIIGKGYNILCFHRYFDVMLFFIGNSQWFCISSKFPSAVSQLFFLFLYKSISTRHINHYRRHKPGCRQLFIANSLKRASAFKTLSKPGFLLT